MREMLLNTKEDLDWLQDVHFKDRVLPDFASAVLIGNEDCPEAIKLYKDKEPLITDRPAVYSLMESEDQGFYYELADCPVWAIRSLRKNLMTQSDENLNDDKLSEDY